jgi:protein-tyrosine phosphatase
MQRLVADAGLADWISVESAGTAAYHVGEKPDRRSRQAARQRGVDLASRASQFTKADFGRCDYVLAMDLANLRNLEAIRPRRGFDGHLGLLREFDPIAPPGAEVPDPYYGGPGGFEEVLDLCEAACRVLLDQIQRDLGRSETEMP